MHSPSPRDAPVISAVRPRRSNSAAGAAAQGRDGGGTGGLVGMQASYRCRGVIGTVLCRVSAMLCLGRAAAVWCSFSLVEPKVLLHAKGLTIGTFF